MQKEKSNQKNPKTKKSFKEKLKHAFSVNPEGKISENEMEVLTKTAQWIQKKNIVTPAIFFLESLSPLNFIGSQSLVFLKPLLGPFFPEKDYEALVEVLEKRESIHILIDKIVEIDQIESKKRKTLEK